MTDPGPTAVIGRPPGPDAEEPGSGAPRPRRRVLPARWRITAWIILSTVVTLLAVGIFGRNLFLSGVEQGANTEIEQEAAEFRRFIEDGRAARAGSLTALLEDYVAMQSVHRTEVVLGLVDGRVVAVADGRTEVAGERPALDAAMRQRILAADAVSGTTTDPDAGPIRWGRVDVVRGDESGALVILQFTADERAAIDDAVVVVAVVALIGIVLSSGVAWLVAGQILAPVRAVSRVAREIGEHDLSARVPVEGHDDIAAMATTFNQMLDRLEEVHATQQRFVDDAGHELRTPITVVRGHLELLGDDPVERRETLRLVGDELARMSRIVADLLILARAQQPDFVRTAACDVATLTLDIEAKAQALGDRRWQLMEVAEGPAPLDPQRITQAVLQLAANAVQVTADGDRIRIGSRFDGDGAARILRFWVQDTGPGVAAQDAERIFERFVRGGAPGDTRGRRPGSGLGLAIVRAISDAHGGSAWVDSVPGEGATFGIDVPAPLADPQADLGRED
ncbi:MULTISPECIES: sensor histidine kinase [unclassified Microbacterium]|uniref:sensor histidine kinase n=1 Tax=unclassified Microbacterium TaxID=2609290 RepID=UPI0022F030E3|nr:HAMP domain-containing sensor histidine kinase [Streptomyces sp. MS2A]